MTAAPTSRAEPTALLAAGGAVKYLYFWGHRPEWQGENLLGFALMRARSILSGNA
jgi:predicted NAD-dependent protein-ADP-ribosyltransferase YbiA (DUF1768 family)